ncbi:MAG: hypothetical protein EXX96DRAFT_572577 [Benjaminiella poitrasii]|nr:MAG: hypothetical protein EXX96DRAFT_572577 [Benjaminiella poitrasii]
MKLFLFLQIHLMFTYHIINALKLDLLLKEAELTMRKKLGEGKGRCLFICLFDSSKAKLPHIMQCNHVNYEEIVPVNLQ